MIKIPTGAKPTAPPAKPGIIFDKESHTYRMNTRTHGIDYQRVTGVTSILGNTLAKPQLERYKLHKVAEVARQNLPEVMAMRDDVARGRMSPEAFDSKLVKMSQKERDRAAKRGDEVHNLGERLSHGEVIETPKAKEVRKPIEQYQRWLDENHVEVILTERQCGNRAGWYAGTFDLIGKFHAGERAGQMWMIDLKTSKAVRPETVLQAIAYAEAEFYVDENQQDRPMPKIDGIGVMHLGNSGAEFYDLGDMQAAADEFAAVLLLHNTVKRREALVERKTW